MLGFVERFVCVGEPDQFFLGIPEILFRLRAIGDVADEHHCISMRIGIVQREPGELIQTQGGHKVGDGFVGKLCPGGVRVWRAESLMSRIMPWWVIMLATVKIEPMRVFFLGFCSSQVRRRPERPRLALRELWTVSQDPGFIGP